MVLTLSNTFLQTNLTLRPHLQPLSTKKSTAIRINCRKKDIHPEFYYDAKVYCNGEHVMTTGGTQKEYVVDVWSGNHPFFLGDRSKLLVEDGQLEKFRRKYGEITQIMQIPVLKGEIVIPPNLKSVKKKKK